MKALVSLGLVLILIIVAFIGVAAGGGYFFGVLLPYLALACFVVGFGYRVIAWAKSPVPFRIPTTCGQQKSLPWIKQAKIENPTSRAGVIGRMVLEILFFRSLFRNTRVRWSGEAKMSYGSSKWLWLGGLAFHWSLFTIITRHLRLALNPVPGFIQGIAAIDSFLQIGVPVLYLTDVLILVALTYLILRRFFVPQVKYISLAADYFPLFLIFGIASTGILMRYFFKVDLVKVKELMLSLASFSPQLPEEIGILFYIHLFLVCTLLAYFPFSKLMHLGGIFLSPTRNLANTSRIVRHINPWDYPVQVHTYAEYEEEFRSKMKKAGIPIETE